MKKFYISIALFILVLAGIAALWKFHERKKVMNQINSFSDTVKNATNDAYTKLQFPPGIDDGYKANTVGQLMFLLDACLTPGKALQALIPPQNCEPLVICAVNSTMKALPPDQFVSANRDTQSDDKAVELFRSCVARYRK